MQQRVRRRVRQQRSPRGEGGLDALKPEEVFGGISGLDQAIRIPSTEWKADRITLEAGLAFTLLKAGWRVIASTKPETVTTTVEEITGAPARTFREWAIDHAGDFR